MDFTDWALNGSCQSGCTTDQGKKTPPYKSHIANLKVRWTSMFSSQRMILVTYWLGGWRLRFGVRFWHGFVALWWVHAFELARCTMDLNIVSFPYRASPWHLRHGVNEDLREKHELLWFQIRDLATCTRSYIPHRLFLFYYWKLIA